MIVDHHDDHYRTTISIDAVFLSYNNISLRWRMIFLYDPISHIRLTYFSLCLRAHVGMYMACLLLLWPYHVRVHVYFTISAHKSLCVKVPGIEN